MPNTTPPPAPPGALDATPQPDFGKLFGEFARFMQKEQYNAIEPMENTSNQPLNCIIKGINNTPSVLPIVTITTFPGTSKTYPRCIGSVNGRVQVEVSSADKAYNRREVEKALAEAGFAAPKNLAPVMRPACLRKPTAKPHSYED